MKCPRCNGNLNPSSLRELSITYDSHECAGCHGWWIGPRQLNEIEGTVDRRFVEIRRLPSDQEQQAVLKCPACAGGIEMKKAISRRDEEVVVDSCPNCQHIWLDRGEREAIEQESIIALIEDFFVSK